VIVDYVRDGIKYLVALEERFFLNKIISNSSFIKNI
jgi:hypothetical protein